MDISNASGKFAVLSALKTDPNLVLTLTGRIISARAKFLSRNNVSEKQFEVIRTLAKEEGYLSMTDLSKKVGNSTAAATGLADRLEKLGFVQRLHASDDRRKVLLQVTRRGIDLVDGVASLAETAMEELLEDIADDLPK